MKQWLLIPFFLILTGCATEAKSPQSAKNYPNEIFLMVPDASRPLTILLDNPEQWRSVRYPDDDSWTTTMLNNRGAQVRISPALVTSEDLLVIQEEAALHRWAFATSACSQQPAYGNWSHRTCLQKSHSIMRIDGEVVWLQFDRLPNVTVVVDGMWPRGDEVSKTAFERLVASAQISCSPRELSCP